MTHAMAAVVERKNISYHLLKIYDSVGVYSTSSISRLSWKFKSTRWCIIKLN